MSDASSNYAITTLRRGGRSAAKVLADADPLARSSDERDAAREAVRSDPGAALAVINQASAETGLTLAGRWRALETTVGLIGDDASAGDMIPDHVRADDLVDILRAGGDLPSSAANVVPRDVVLAAIFGELAEGIDADTDADAFIQRVIVLERWAHNLKDRPDYAELLNEEVGDWTVKHLLVAGLALRHGIPIRGDDRDDVRGVDGFIPTGVLVDVGLDTEDVEELLDQVRDFELGEFDAGSVASAYAALARKREQFQQATTYVAPQVGSDDDL